MWNKDFKTSLKLALMLKLIIFLSILAGIRTTHRISCARSFCKYCSLPNRDRRILFLLFFFLCLGSICEQLDQLNKARNGNIQIEEKVSILFNHPFNIKSISSILNMKETSAETICFDKWHLRKQIQCESLRDKNWIYHPHAIIKTWSLLNPLMLEQRCKCYILSAAMENERNTKFVWWCGV